MKNGSKKKETETMTKEHLMIGKQVRVFLDRESRCENFEYDNCILIHVCESHIVCKYTDDNSDEEEIIFYPWHTIAEIYSIQKE